MKEEKLNKICGLIGENLGQSIVNDYRNFYQDKTDDFILTSVENLLKELIGPKATREQLSRLNIEK